MTLRFVLPLCAVVLAAGCAARMGAPQSGTLPAISASNRAQDGGSLIVRVHVPVHPDFVSPSTKGMTVKIVGPTKLKKTVGLVLGANGCKSKLTTLSCALLIPNLASCPTKKACYTASVATYDAYDAHTKKIPPGAHELSAEQKFPFHISKGNNTIAIALQGIPASVVFLPAPNTALSGTQAAGYVEPKCTASAQTVTLLGVDADGNYILGVGAPKASLTSGDTAQLSVTQAGANTFTLVPPSAPAYAFGNHAVHLTATMTPGSKSGGVAVSANVNVAYSGDICGIMTEFTVPTAASGAHGLGAGPDGNVWFVEQTANKVASITPAGIITEYSVPTASSRPFNIATGPDGNLWFTELAANKIGRITTAGVVTEYPVPTGSSSPESIAAGPDGNVWFSEVSVGNVAKITPGGSVTEYTVGVGSQPTGIAAGPDGNMWFDDQGAIGRVTPTGSVAEYTPITSGNNSGVAAGPDGGMWFAECTANKIGRMTTSGVTTSEFPLPEASSAPDFITRGPDGNLWFSEYYGNRVGGITPAGSIVEYAVPTGASTPFDVQTGPDGAIWFVELATNKIGRLR